MVGIKIVGLKFSRPKFQSEAKNLVTFDRLFLPIRYFHPSIFILQAAEASLSSPHRNPHHVGGELPSSFLQQHLLSSRGLHQPFPGGMGRPALDFSALRGMGEGGAGFSTMGGGRGYDFICYFTRRKIISCIIITVPF